MKDYCTFWPDWLGDVYIGGCCKAHDLAYANGEPRIPADILLGQCVEDLGLPAWGSLMSIAVMALGWIFYPKRHR